MADFEFGKLDFSTSFKPTSAFPLNANCLFSTLEAAQQAAATAEEPGSKNTLYHYGMQLLVVTDTTANWYKITRQKTLEELGSGGSGSGTATLEPATSDKLGGVKVGQNLNVTTDGILSVATTNNAEEDNTKPITSAGTYTIVGNIEVLLKTI